MSKFNYPGASRSQNFEKTFTSDKMDDNVAILHTTEGVNWPGYGGGKTAPNYTFFAAIKEKRGYWREHFAANLSSRALENRPGGVQTNTLNAVQIELIGTCDSRYRKKWGNLTAGTDYIYWPDAPQWALDELACFFRWLIGVAPRFKAIDGAPRGWIKYPDSYGLNARQRLTFAEWNNSVGILGHQHVPENVHGDPGDLNIKAIVAAVSGATIPTKPPRTPDPVIKDQMDPAQYFIGAKGDHITWLGNRLVVWSKALGLRAPYKVGPGPSFTETDRKAVAAFQKAQGWTGGDADGFPGEQSLAILASEPKPKPAPKPKTTLDVDSISLNCAGYDKKRGMANRVQRAKTILAPVLLAKKPTWIHLQECAIDMWPELDKRLPGYTRVPQGGKGRESYYRNDIGIKILGAKLSNVTHMLKADTKEFLMTAWELDGFRGVETCFHNENEGILFQKSQLHDVLNATYKFADTFGISHLNMLATGDSNRKQAARDIVAWRWKDAGTNAPKRINEGFHSTNGWSHSTPGDRIDVDCVAKDAIVVSYEQILTPIVADHNAHYVVRSLIK